MDMEARSMWELYLKVFRPINRYMTTTKNGMHVNLPYLSPRLDSAHGLMVPIMGQELIQNHDSGRQQQSHTHATRHSVGRGGGRVGGHLSSYVTIQSMDSDITLMASKQRPRRIAFWGSDGKK